MAKITGADKHRATLSRIRGPAMKREVGKAILAAAGLIADDAAKSITTGAVGGKNHQPSSPGSPPNADTGVLDRSIHPEKTGELTAAAVADAPYAAIQEFGGTINHPGGTPFFLRGGKAVFVSKSGQGAFHGLPVTKPHKIVLEARPFMEPAAKRMTPKAEKLVREAAKRVVKGGTL